MSFGKTDARLKAKLKSFENHLGCKAKITSGKRSKKHNKKVGGSKNSYHLAGKAYDLQFPKCKYNLELIAKKARRFFNGVIIYPNHIHVDIRDKKYFGRGKY